MYDLTRTPVECILLYSTGFLYNILYINSEGVDKRRTPMYITNVD